MSARIQRFCKTTRWFHWTFVSAFLTLAATGAGLAGREALGLGAESVDALLQVHKAAGVALFVLPALVFLSGDTAATESARRGTGSESDCAASWRTTQGVRQLVVASSCRPSRGTGNCGICQP